MKQSCFVGFDGFVDTLTRLVKTRTQSTENPSIETFSTISEWAQSLQLAAGKSCNYELAFARKCAGGNAVNLARALAKLGYNVDLAANIGDSSNGEKIDSVFLDHLHQMARTVNLGIAGQTQALEFNDGKLLLGIQGKNASLSLKDLEFFLGPDWLENWIWNKDLIALVNWTMTPNLGAIWNYLGQNPPKTKKKRTLLIDLADPRKRSQEELARDLKSLETLSKHDITVILSFNKSEAEQSLQALGGKLPLNESLDKELLYLAQAIGQKLPSFVIVIHDSKLSVMYGIEKKSLRYGKVITSPLVLTGGGDHFNAGLSHALMQDYEPDQCLDTAMSCASHYIVRGQSPSAQELSF